MNFLSCKIVLLMVLSIISTSILAGTEKQSFAVQLPQDCKNTVNASFPSSSATKQTHWQLCWEEGPGNGVVIKYARFRPTSTSPFIEVLYTGMIGEIFVPYHPGSPRYFDITDFDFRLLSLSLTDCPARNGTLLGSSKIVCREIRDRGLAWKHDGRSKRGEELVLWGVIDAGNYNYVVEWTFRDDGTVAGRLGSTGPKLNGEDDDIGHMHTFTWKLDMDLAGAEGDSVHITKHVEGRSSLSSSDSNSLISQEAGVQWKPFQFTTLKVTDSTFVNANRRPLSYELIPLRTGFARHKEAYTQQDFWVTAYKANENSPRDLPSYITGESIAKKDIVIWYTGSAHHESHMRDEDRQAVPMKWTGFELSPQNMFTKTPFF